MTRAKVVRFNETTYLSIPAAEARALNLRAGQTVELEIRPAGATAREIAASVFGALKGRIDYVPDKELYGED